MEHEDSEVAGLVEDADQQVFGAHCAGRFYEFVGTQDDAAESRCHVLTDVPTDVGLLPRVEFASRMALLASREARIARTASASACWHTGETEMPASRTAAARSSER